MYSWYSYIWSTIASERKYCYMKISNVKYLGVFIQRNGTVEWNDGMEWNGMEWNGMERLPGMRTRNCFVARFRIRLSGLWVFILTLD